MGNFRYLSKNHIVLFHDLIVCMLALPAAYWLKSNLIYFEIDSKLILTFTFVFLSKFISVFFFKLHKGIWRFASIKDLILIIKATVVGVLIYVFALFLLNRVEFLPRSIIILDTILTLFLLGAGRFTYRVYKDNFKKSVSGEKIIIIGAGRAGEQLVREIQKNLSFKYEIVGILDDDKEKFLRRVHQVPVRGNSESLSQFINDKKVDKVILAIPSASSIFVRKISDVCIKNNIKLLTLPGLKDVVDGKVNVSSLRPVNIDDLLGREKVELSNDKISSVIKNSIVLVTGAGGSIGSELCIQISKFSPTKIILFELNEYALYNVERRLIKLFPEIEFISFLGDVKNEKRVQEVILKYSPSVVFHAAAYKHVPLVENNPSEAIFNNIAGTNTLAHACSINGVKRFVLISTDKAVNPTNVMGATKRVAEMICQLYQKNELNKTIFSIVRFGNVLGSAGSVVPLFLEQIQNGGPVTITHPDITRYFMSIPEAAQLVLEAGTLGKGGEIFVLEMGEPVKITNLAFDLIRLSGLKVDEDIKIKFTGLRQGEKLYEELLSDKEKTLPTCHEKVRVAAAREITSEDITLLKGILTNINPMEQLKTLCELVPEYRSTNDTLWN